LETIFQAVIRNWSKTAALLMMCSGLGLTNIFEFIQKSDILIF